MRLTVMSRVRWAFSNSERPRSRTDSGRDHVVSGIQRSAEGGKTGDGHHGDESCDETVLEGDSLAPGTASASTTPS